MLTTLDLQYVSPELLNARNLELAVPGKLSPLTAWKVPASRLSRGTVGTYHSKRKLVKIASFAPTLAVITSKQRPRRLNLRGDDGKEYQYVLKGAQQVLVKGWVKLKYLTGHEDLRQDERVMQLFGLVNTLLAIDPDSFKRHLHIQRYPVIPLAPNAGLLGWVQDSDTLHILVKEYRDSRKILLNIEYRLMLQVCVGFGDASEAQRLLL